MSDLSTLSHTYAEWNARLGAINQWLLSVRKTRDGLQPGSKTVDVPQEVRTVLRDVAETLNPTSERATSAVPLSIKRNLVNRLRTRTGRASYRLSELLEKKKLLVDDLTDDDIQVLRDVVASLDDEVTSLYNRMRRYR